MWRVVFLLLLAVYVSLSAYGASPTEKQTGRRFLERDYKSFEALYMASDNKDYFSHPSGAVIGYIDFSISFEDERFFSLVVQHGDPNFPDEMGFTPIFTAAMNCKLDKARRLVERGARVDLFSPSQGASPLHLAVLAGCHDVAEFLVSLGARSLSGSDALSTPLELAIEQNDERMISIVQEADR